MKKLTMNDVTSGISTAAAARVASGAAEREAIDSGAAAITKDAEKKAAHELRSAAAKKAAATRAKNRAAKAAEKIAESSKKTVARANDKQAAAAVQVAAERNAELAKASVKDSAKKKSGVSSNKDSAKTGAKAGAKASGKSERKAAAAIDAEKAKAAEKQAAAAKVNDEKATEKRAESKIDTEMCITVKNAHFVRPGKLEEFCNYVRYDIASAIFKAAEKSISGPRAAIEKNHANVSFLTMSKDDLRKYAHELTRKVKGKKVKYTAADIEDLVNKREAFKAARRNLKAQTITSAQFSALHPTDRFFVDVVAIRNYSGVSLERSVIYTGERDEKGRPIELDFMPAVKTSYTSAGAGKLADIVRTLIHKTAGAPGVLCYGIAVTAKQVKDSEEGVNLEHFKASLHGGAKIDDTGKYVYFFKDASTVFVRELTRFISVLLDNGDYSLVKDSKKRAAKKDSANK